VRTTLRSDAVVLDTAEALVAVAGGTSPQAGLDVKVTSRRLAVSGRTSPFVTLEGRLPWVPGSVASGESDLSAWWTEFQALVDAGASSVRFMSAEGGEESALRLDEARAMLAAGVGLVPEIAMPAGSARLPSVPILLASPDTLRPIETLSAPPEIAVPAPLPLPDGTRFLPLSIERDLHLASRPVRVLRDGALSRDLALSAFLLGCAGVVVRADAPGPQPGMAGEMLRANMLASLLQPAAHTPAVAVLGTPEADPALSALLDGLPFDWGNTSALGAADMEAAVGVALTGSATPFDGADGADLLTWVREGGRLLAPAGALASAPDGPPATPEAFGATLPVGSGWLVGLRLPSEGESPGAVLDAALEWASIPRVGERTPVVTRFVRTPAGGGGEIVAAFARDGVAGRVALLVGGHTVEVGVRPGDPAWAAGDTVGVWAVSGCGDVVIDGRSLLSGPVDCPVACVSLRRATLDTGGEYMLFCDPIAECYLRLGAHKDAPPLVLWRGRRVGAKMVQTAYTCSREDEAGGMLLHVIPLDSGLIPIAAPRDLLPRAVERVQRLGYGG
jgi:hypothetical protein